MSKILLVRHGQSFWNLENKFTGSVDIALTDNGRQEAMNVRNVLSDWHINLAYASSLIRAQETAFLALSSQGRACERVINSQYKSTDTLPVIIDSRLDERCYGNLQGMNKDKARSEFGVEQVMNWRRSFAERPPGGESLEDTVVRVRNFVINTLVKTAEQGLNIAIFAHGNSIRALHMLFLDISEEEIMKFEVETGQILYYCYNKGRFYHE